MRTVLGSPGVADFFVGVVCFLRELAGEIIWSSARDLSKSYSDEAGSSPPGFVSGVTSADFSSTAWVFVSGGVELISGLLSDSAACGLELSAGGEGECSLFSIGVSVVLISTELLASASHFVSSFSFPPGSPSSSRPFSSDLFSVTAFSASLPSKLSLTGWSLGLSSDLSLLLLFQLLCGLWLWPKSSQLDGPPAPP